MNTNTFLTIVLTFLFIFEVWYLLKIFYLNITCDNSTSNKDNTYLLYNEPYATPNTPKVYFLSFASDSFYNALNRIKDQAKSMNIFDEILCMTDKDLKNDKEFWAKHGNFIEQNGRGYGYWLWKPYLNSKLFDRINDNDIVVYADSGCELNPKGMKRLHEYFDKVNKSNYGMLTFDMEHLKEKCWTKNDLIEFMDPNNKNNHKETGQYMATSFIYRKCDHVKKLFNEWYKLAQDYHNINNDPSKSKNDDCFGEHRHDQSLFSLLRKKYKTEVISDETYPPGNEKMPIWASRKR